MKPFMMFYNSAWVIIKDWHEAVLLVCLTFLLERTDERFWLCGKGYS
jgi:hypothetical protein